MSSLSFTATVFILCRLRSRLCGCRLCRGHHSSLRAYTSLLRSDSPSIIFVSIRFMYLDQMRGFVHFLLFGCCIALLLLALINWCCWSI
ncbi:unnamed protein product [Cuscuta campestris]|uniref:Uncharacterized protein n=1 Tax=Cuscuta campestris TaxID=132261 RepID=A0A484N9L9_9ASTE|nr:unnamed protein product [Cuscuta campestris]